MVAKIDRVGETRVMWYGSYYYSIREVFRH